MSLQEAEYILESETASKKLAQKIATFLKPGNIVTFSGTLGTGKTFFCREIIRSLCGKDTNVTSPTFNLLQIYSTDKFDIYHFDLYRLKSPEEVFELGIEEAFAGHICLIEWPEIIESFLPLDRIRVNLEIISPSIRRCLINSL